MDKQVKMNLLVNKFLMNWQYLAADVGDIQSALEQGSLEVVKQDIERAAQKLELLQDLCDELEVGEIEE